MKELDELITYIENDLIGEHKDIEIIDQAIKKYAELYHKKQLLIHSVSQQRELFNSKETLNFKDWTKREGYVKVNHYLLFVWCLVWGFIGLLYTLVCVFG